LGTEERVRRGTGSTTAVKRENLNELFSPVETKCGKGGDKRNPEVFLSRNTQVCPFSSQKEENDRIGAWRRGVLRKINRCVENTDLAKGQTTAGERQGREGCIGVRLNKARPADVRMRMQQLRS